MGTCPGGQPDTTTTKGTTMNAKIKKVVGVGVSAFALGVGMIAVTAAPSQAATSKGTATVSEGRKVVREADRQHCLTLREVRKIVHGTGTKYDTGWAWRGTGKADVLAVEFNGGKCVQTAILGYDNGNALAWIDGRVLWA